MTLEAAKRTRLVLILASGLALGEGARPAAEGAADLDFSEDFPAHHRAVPAGSADGGAARVTRKLPPSPSAAAPRPSPSWVYWTAGMAAMAAGGAAWYLHWGARTAPDPVRTEQVFTDEPD